MRRIVFTLLLLLFVSPTFAQSSSDRRRTRQPQKPKLPELQPPSPDEEFVTQLTQEWLYIDSTKDMQYFYKPEYSRTETQIVNQRNTATIKTWILAVVRPPFKDNLDKKNPKMRYSKTLFDFACDNNLLAIAQVIDYDQEGKNLKSTQADYLDWFEPPPESVGDGMLKYFCTSPQRGTRTYGEHHPNEVLTMKADWKLFRSDDRSSSFYIAELQPSGLVRLTTALYLWDLAREYYMVYEVNCARKQLRFVGWINNSEKGEKRFIALAGKWELFVLSDLKSILEMTCSSMVEQQ
ncbi:MAG: hypothetical protein QOC96_2799 [Acidobacteriota bacterium]|jgi:hypothetical protein|nr:hypothetical protein [Acidobacteriota bacterium]